MGKIQRQQKKMGLLAHFYFIPYKTLISWIVSGLYDPSTSPCKVIPANSSLLRCFTSYPTASNILRICLLRPSVIVIRTRDELLVLSTDIKSTLALLVLLPSITTPRVSFSNDGKLKIPFIRATYVFDTKLSDFKILP